MEETLVVRVMGTFIDITSEAEANQKKRSSSCPPGRSSAHSELEAFGKEEYLSSWMDKASNMLRVRAHSMPDHVKTPSEATDRSSGKETRLSLPQRWCDVDEIQVTSCKCGAAFVNYGRFCHQCGAPKEEVANNSPASTTWSDGLQNNSPTGSKWSDCYAGGAQQRSDSWDTLPSVGSFGQETASTLDSQSLLDPAYRACEAATPCMAPIERWFEQGPSWQQQAQDPITAGNSYDLVDNVTTLMMCDIPCRQTIAQVVDVINDHGYMGTYDFVYMPPQKGFRRPKHSHNMGYAFINFKRPEFAAGFGHVFQNYSFPHCASTKLSYTKPAHCQGFKANMDMHSKQQLTGCLLLY